jgi:hypothetical protein
MLSIRFILQSLHYCGNLIAEMLIFNLFMVCLTTLSIALTANPDVEVISE